MVDDRRIQQLLSSRASPARMVDALIAEANGRGGLDNITAIVVRIDGLGEGTAPKAMAPGAAAPR
jgi:protein phosphatase